MSDNNRVEIPLSKAKLSKLLVFCILFVAAGVWMITKNPQTSNPVFNNVILKTIAAYGAVLMGLLGIYFFSKKLFDREPGVVVSSEGIYDNTSAFKFGLIPWTDISEIKERSMQVSLFSKQSFVTIRLTDPDKYISRATNSFKRKMLQANSKQYGTPVNISTNGLKTNHKDLFILIKEYFEKYRKQA